MVILKKQIWGLLKKIIGEKLKNDWSFLNFLLTQLKSCFGSFEI
jgi:hypothetical protein